MAHGKEGREAGRTWRVKTVAGAGGDEGRVGLSCVGECGSEGGDEGGVEGAGEGAGGSVSEKGRYSRD